MPLARRDYVIQVQGLVLRHFRFPPCQIIGLFSGYNKDSARLILAALDMLQSYHVEVVRCTPLIKIVRRD